MSSEVPTDAFIGAKFTLCARRKLPLFGLKVQLTYVYAARGLFLIKSDSLTGEAGRLHSFGVKKKPKKPPTFGISKVQLVGAKEMVDTVSLKTN